MSEATEHRVLVVGSTHLTTAVTDRLAEADDLTVETTPELTDGGVAEGIACVVLPVKSASVDDLLRLDRIRTSYPDLPVVVALATAEDAPPTPAQSPVDVVRLDAAPPALAARVRTRVASDDTATVGYEEQFRALVEHSPAMIAVLDETGRYRYVSPSVERVLGYAPDDLVGQVAFDQIHDDDRDHVIETFTAAVANPDSRPSAEYRYRHADGEWRVLRSWGKNRLDDPAVGGFVVITLDVTERIEYERDLERHQAMVETVADGVYALDEDLRVTTVNEAALELTGYSREEALGSHISRFLDDADKAKADQMREAVVASDQAGATIELSIRRTDGSSFPAEVRFRLFDPDAAAYTGSAGVIRDITERKERERDLARQNERLEEFASVVSHDLRNPLNTAQGYVDLVGTDCDSEHLDTVNRELDRMETLIADTLTLAREGRTVESSTPVALDALVAEAWTSVALAGTLEVEFDDVTIMADPDRLQRVFENLFRNAAEHAGPGVTVRVGLLAADRGVSVADDGPGIPEPERDAVFDHGYTTSDDGTGFGLSIVRSIVEAHGWDIAVTESAAGGAQFEITGVELS